MNCCNEYGQCGQGHDCPARDKQMTTKKHPRTMQEAFGPYTSHTISEAVPPYDWQDKLVMTACAIVSFGLAIAVLWGAV